MTEKHERKVTLEEFDSDVRLVMRLLKTDIWGIQRLIEVAKEELPERDIEIRRELRPLAVELLYSVIGTPKTFEEILSDVEKQEDEDGD
jgi:hypothetical protein